ncbi:MAG: hypothetical protein IJV13_08365 [Prevotella sp.]|nr:hypothetical protein [Prevotella sp.]
MKNQYYSPRTAILEIDTQNLLQVLSNGNTDTSNPQPGNGGGARGREFELTDIRPLNLWDADVEEE